MYLARLMGYDYTIHYHSGSSNVVADALSRILEISPGTLLSLSVPCFTFLEELKRQLHTDPHYTTLRQAIAANPTAYPEHKLTQDLILHKGRIWLPNTFPFITSLLAEFYSSSTVGHIGIAKTMARINENFVWSGIHKSLTRASPTVGGSLIGFYCWVTTVSGTQHDFGCCGSLFEGDTFGHVDSKPYFTHSSILFHGYCWKTPWHASKHGF